MKSLTKTSPEEFSEQFLDLFGAFPGVVFRLQNRNEEFVPTWVGRNFTVVSGYPIETIIGNSIWWTDLIYPQDRPLALAAIETASATGAASCQYRLKHRDGSCRWIREEIRINQCDPADTAIGLIGTWSDITGSRGDDGGLKSPRAVLREAREQVQKANAAKGEFLSVMSHELRTPLNAIIGFSDVILMKTFGPIEPSRYISYVQDINNSGKRLLDLVNDILDVSALESGKFVQQPGPVDVGKICKNGVNLVIDRAEKGKIHLGYHIEPGIPSLIVDKQRLKQILVNLLSNAVKFTPEHGEVILRAGTGPSGGIRFEISDTGIGMDEQDLEIAFSNFGQVDSTLARKYEGSGLGLPLSKGIVEAMQGVLEVRSRPGRGTTVIVQFPRSRSIAPDGAGKPGQYR